MKKSNVSKGNENCLNHSTEGQGNATLQQMEGGKSMRQISVTERAFLEIKSYRDEGFLNYVKSNLFDAACEIIDDASGDDVISGTALRALVTISDFNDLITELSKTEE